MLIQRKNPLGGRPLGKNHWPLHEDKDGNFGLLIGYDHTGDKMLISIRDAEDFASAFALTIGEYRHKVHKMENPYSLSQRLGLWILKQLLGKKMYYKILNEGIPEEDV